MAWLITEGAAHQIGEGETVVGSGPRARWRLAAHDLAARHFVLEELNGQVAVRAASAETVVAVNGHQIGAAPTPLQNGDTIDAGTGRFVFSTAQRDAVPAPLVGPAHFRDAKTGVVHPLTEQSVGIGRDRTNAIVIRDPTASRFHAEVRREAGGYVLHPHGSSGTVLNGRRVGTPERLSDGDRLQVANVELEFAAAPAPEAAPRAQRPSGDTESSQRPTIIQSDATAIPAETRSTAWIWIVAAVIVAAGAFFILR